LSPPFTTPQACAPVPSVCGCFCTVSVPPWSSWVDPWFSSSVGVLSFVSPLASWCGCTTCPVFQLQPVVVPCCGRFATRCDSSRSSVRRGTCSPCACLWSMFFFALRLHPPAVRRGFRFPPLPHRATVTLLWTVVGLFNVNSFIVRSSWSGVFDVFSFLFHLSLCQRVLCYLPLFYHATSAREFVALFRSWCCFDLPDWGRGSGFSGSSLDAPTYPVVSCWFPNAWSSSPRRRRVRARVCLGFGVALPSDGARHPYVPQSISSTISATCTYISRG
jgi:hypothetical protein